jgi:rfaE bifunctional protein nucleotidyltransferase chain/domain
MSGKIVDNETMLAEASRLRAAGRRLVVMTGCFDLLHVGHVRSLAAARALGDALLVLVHGDGAVRFLKGPGRPVVPGHERAEVLAALAVVEYVSLYEHIDPNPFLARLAPARIAKGPDYVGGYVQERDGPEGQPERVCVVVVDPGPGTTALIERIRSAELE